ncbi:MAG: PKD domain-containing protein [Bacteroidota bacterium]
MMFNRYPKLTYLLGALLFVGFFTGCPDDDDPIIPTGDAPTASFTFTVNADDVLTIDFTNTSTDAVSYVWDFGDGNSSTEESPTHTYAGAGAYTVQLTATNAEGNNSTSSTVTVQSPYRTNGFVIGSILPATGASTSYTDYYSGDGPSGDIDLTEGQSAATQFYSAIHGPFIYGRPRVSGEFGVAKFAIDANTDELVEVGRINTLDAIFRIVIVDDNLGFASSFNNLDLIAFNPTTMETIQTIDLSVDTPLPPVDENSNRGTNGLYYNAKTGKLIVALHWNASATPAFYDLQDAFIEVIDVASLTRDGSSRHPQATYVRMNAEDNVVTDEAGNLYIIAQGSYGLDGQVGPTAPARSKPQILKIDAATSQFDTTYAWNPIAAAGFGDALIQVFASMVGTGTTQAYGLGSATPTPPRLLQLLQLFATGMLDEDGFNELRQLVFESESGRLMELDLVAKTAIVVETTPLTAGFSYPYLYNYDGKIYSQVSSQAFNGFYVTDPSDNSSEPVFNLTGGGFATSYLRLTE